MFPSPARRHLRAAATVAVTAALALTGLGVVGSAPAAAARPGNDDLAAATPLTTNVFEIGSTDEATLELGELRGNGFAYRTIWYRYTPPVNQRVMFQTRSTGDNVDTFITLWSGPAGATSPVQLTQVGHNDDGAGLLSFLPAQVTAGTTYYLQVDTADPTVPHGSFGTRVIDLGATSLGPPPQDDLAGADRLFQGIGPTVDLRRATTEPAEPQQAGCAAPIHHSAWYHYTPTIDRPLTFGTAGAADSVLNVYRGPVDATAGRLAAVACDADATGDSRVTVAATAGTRYYVQLGSSTPAGAVPTTLFVEDATWDEPAKVTASATLTPRSLVVDAAAVVDPYLDSAGPFPPLTGSLELVEAHESLASVAAVAGTTGRLRIPRPAPGFHDYVVIFHAGSVTYTDAFRIVAVTVPKLASRTTVKAPGRITVRTVRGADGTPVVRAEKVRIRAVVRTGGAKPTGKVVFRIGGRKVRAKLKRGVATIRVGLRKTTRVKVTYAGDAHTTGSGARKKIKVVVEHP